MRMKQILTCVLFLVGLPVLVLGIGWMVPLLAQAPRGGGLPLFDRGGAAPAAGRDGELLRGTWRLVAGVKDGQAVFASDTECRMTFGADAVSVVVGATRLEGTYRIDPRAEPKQLELHLKGKARPERWVYRWELGHLVVSYHETAPGRPTAFSPKPGQVLLVLQRGDGKAVADAKEEARRLREQLLAERARLEKELANLRTRNKIDATIVERWQQLLEKEGAKDEAPSKLRGAVRQLLAERDRARAQQELLLLAAEQERAEALRREAEAKRALARQEYMQALRRAQQMLQEKALKLDDQAPPRNQNRPAGAKGLQQIGLAMHNYHDQHGHFPAAAVSSKEGRPLLSWRVAILPYLNQDKLYRQFKLDEPWDSPHNKKLLAQMPAVFAAPGQKDGQATHYQVFTGPKTVFEGSRGARLAEITDGASSTILAIEAANAVPWTKPADLSYTPDGKLPEVGRVGGILALLADGSVHTLPRDIDQDTLRRLILPADGGVVDLQRLQRKE